MPSAERRLGRFRGSWMSTTLLQSRFLHLKLLHNHTEHLGDKSLSAALPTIQSCPDPQKIAWTRNVVLPWGSIDTLGVVVPRFPRKVAVIGCMGLPADAGKAVPLLHKLVSLSSINVPQLVCYCSANLPSPAHIRS